MPIEPGENDMSHAEYPVVEINDSTRIIANLVVEAWRFTEVFQSVLSRVDPNDVPRYMSRARYFQSKLTQSLEAAGLRIVDLTGQDFSVGIAATALNAEDFETDDVLVVDYMVEPLIMSGAEIVNYATVVVRRS
jgi:hypothetical protein